MNMIDLAKASKWKDVKRAIRFHYPKDKNNYERLFERIQKTSKRGKGTGGLLDIKMVWDVDYEDGQMVDNYLDEQYYSLADLHGDVPYSLSFVPWDKLMRTEISFDTIKKYMKEELLAHFIWEITWHGTEPMAKKVKKMLYSRMKAVKKAKA